MSEQHMSPVPMIRLHDGTEIPQVGLGVLRIDDEGVTPVVESALAAGYRHIDGAAGYNNEGGVGRGPCVGECRLRHGGAPPRVVGHDQAARLRTGV